MPPEYMVDNYMTNQGYRRRILANSMVGKSLEQAFGKKFNDIYWDNANPDHTSTSLAADLQHVKKILVEKKPMVVLCFCASAIFAMRYYKPIQAETPDLYNLPPLEYEYCPLPYTRQITQFQLNEYAQKIIDLYMI